MRLGFFEVSRRFEVGGELFARGEAFHAAIGGRHIVIQVCVGGEDVDERQVVALADGVVVEVVRGGDFQAAGAEFAVHVVIGNDGDFPAGERYADFFADVGAVAFVFGMHGEGDVGKDGFRAGGGDVHVLPVQSLSGDEGVTDVIHESAFFAVFDFEVGDGGFQYRVPVDETLTAIDKAVVVEFDEEGAHGAREGFIHGEALACPVKRGAQAAQLPHDLPTGFSFPFPHFGGEGFAAEVMPRFALCVQLALDDHLRGDAGMVAARLPQGVVAQHAVVADEGIHDGVLEGVAHVQGAGDVRRRNHDGVGLAAAAGGEVVALFPAVVPFVFDVGGLVAGGHAVCVHDYLGVIH